MKLKLLLTAGLLNIVSACTNLPQYVVVSPEVIGYSKGVYFNNNIQLNIIDQRISKHIVQISKNDEAAKLLSSKNSLTHIIEQAIQPVFRKQGITLDQFSNIKVDIVIDTALINVQQQLVNYSAKNTISLKAIVSNNNTVTSKTFNINGTSNGPLTADIAVLERDFNHQLAAILARIANNINIQNAIKAPLAL